MCVCVCCVFVSICACVCMYGAYVILSVLKFVTIELMKFSRIMTALIAFQSVAFSPSSRQIDSNATLTMAGGLAIDRTSTKCCFFIDFTAKRKELDSIQCYALIGVWINVTYE